MSGFPAYTIRSTAMRPISRITILGFRLGIVALVVYWAALFLGTHLPAAVDFSPQVSDKLKHFTAFLGLATLLCYVTTSPNLWRRFSLIAVIALSYAALDEFTQQFVAGRCADVQDFLADAAGIAVAIGGYATARWFFKRRANRAVSS